MDIKNMTTENLWEDYRSYIGELATYERKLNLFGIVTEKDEDNATRSWILCYIVGEELKLRGEL